MDPTLVGLHHVTAMVGDAQRNLDFYSAVLGLRLVKLTVNFDDPGTYHFYFGDHSGQPGTLVTFFPWGDRPQGRRGTGQVTTISFGVAEGSISYWQARLAAQGLNPTGPQVRFGDQVLTFADPDGLELEIVAHPGATERPGQQQSDVPLEHAIRGLHSVTLSVDGYQRSEAMLVGMLGFQPVAQSGKRRRYAAGAGGGGALVDLCDMPELAPGTLGVGIVHHVAFSTPNDEQELAWRARLIDARINVTPVMDREYFHSIYFHEPGGVLYEIATDPPGFATDEALAQLGTSLRLPAQYEPQRPQIERSVVPLRLPTAQEQTL